MPEALSMDSFRKNSVEKPDDFKPATETTRLKISSAFNYGLEGLARDADRVVQFNTDPKAEGKKEPFLNGRANVVLARLDADDRSKALDTLQKGNNLQNYADSCQSSANKAKVAAVVMVVMGLACMIFAIFGGPAGVHDLLPAQIAVGVAGAGLVTGGFIAYAYSKKRLEASAHIAQERIIQNTVIDNQNQQVRERDNNLYTDEGDHEGDGNIVEID